jgi:hypothetical protein
MPSKKTRMAEEYGVNQATIWMIVSGKNWKLP